MAILPGGAALQRVQAYHQRTKHGFGRYAQGPGYLDWDTQPDPFRRFVGATVIPLRLRSGRVVVPYSALFEPTRISPWPLNLESLGILLELAFGLSAWKQYGSERWALRCNPSSGNLHPTEAYVVTSGVPDLGAGVYHYVSHDHALERRCEGDLPLQGILVGLSSIHWREAWKYGERAFRYCQHDVGHALGALRYAAAALGWRVRLLDDWSDEEIAAVLGLDRSDDFASAETESPDLIGLIEPVSDRRPALPPVDDLVNAARGGRWSGQANVLSAKHEQDWPVIEEVAEVAAKARTPPSNWQSVLAAPLLPTVCQQEAADIIKQRRSAQAFDGITSMSARAWFRILDATLPRPQVPPLDVWRWSPGVHLLLFVHRIEGMKPGLYLFIRREVDHDQFRGLFQADFSWETVAGSPEHFRLYRLVQADAQRVARTLSCHQDIAGDGAFSLGMLAEFDEALTEGAWVYRRLFWECGLVGQALYLEAEAAGVRGTGIGCFFDDPVHELLGLSGTALQSLYHFTIGGAVIDQRLHTLPAYGHLQR